MQNQSIIRLLSTALVSAGARVIIDVVTKSLEFDHVIYADAPAQFLHALSSVRNNQTSNLIISEWYQDTLYGSQSANESQQILDNLIKWSRLDSTLVVFLCPFGPGPLLKDAIDSSHHIKIVDGNVTPFHLLRSLSV
jgi:hypothetical protein